MITHKSFVKAQRLAADMVRQTNITVREDELNRIDVVDFGLSELEKSGVQILTLVDTEKISVKLLILFPDQTEPEHLHPRIGEYAGKEETIRCEWGEVFLYGPGEPTLTPKGHPPRKRLSTYSVWKEYHLLPGDQITFQPNTRHWFQAGTQGCVIWSFSTKAIDISDVFTDKGIKRETKIIEDNG
jgi:D-lyxose ketol-isomerase